MDQKFCQQIDLLIRKRYSCRSFTKEPLTQEKFRLLEDFFQKLTIPLASNLRFVWFDKSEVNKEKFFSAGTYGLIKNSRFFMALVCNKNDPKRFLDIGFILEQLVLYATFLDINSCWIGGVFDRRGFSSFLKISADEELPVVIALGYAAEKRSIADRLTRWGAKGDLRKDPAELFFLSGFEKDSWSKIEPRKQQILELVRRAPSASNRQPWRIVISDNSWHIFLKRDPVYQKLLPFVDLQMIDIGIALAHLVLALQNRAVNYRLIEDKPFEPPQNWQYIISVVTPDFQIS